jgi:hypothetical protein
MSDPRTIERPCFARETRSMASFPDQIVLSPQPLEATGARACDRATAAGKTERLQFLDTTRGILLVLMASSHAVGIAAVSRNNFFASSWWLPRGWAAGAFVILSGFTAATVLPWENDPARATSRARDRVRQLLLVMFFSNIFFLIFKLIVQNQAERLMDWKWWVGLVTLKTEYSISGVLLPICLLLLVIPMLAKFHERFGLISLVILSMVFAFLAWKVGSAWPGRVSSSQLLDLLFHRGVGGMPLVPALGSGAIGFAIGFAWKKFKPRVRSTVLMFLIAAYGLLSWDEPFGLPGKLAETAPPLLNLIRFIVILVVATQVLRLPALEGLARWFSILGKYSLCCFLAHRLAIQSFAVTWSALSLRPSEDTRYILLALSALMVSTLLCLMRERSHRVNRALRDLYL